MKLSVYVDNRRIDKDGMKSVFIRCYGSRKEIYMLNTGIKCVYEPVGCVFPKNEKNGRPKSAILSKLFAKCEELVFKHSELPFSEMKQMLIDLVKGKETKSNTALADKILDYASVKKEGTKGIYELTSRKVSEFDNGATFESVDEKWLAGFRLFYIRKGMSANGISIHLRNIRTVFNYARRKRETDNYPFLWFKIEEDETVPNNLTVEEIRRLRDYPVEEWQEVYRDLFMLSFYLAGVNVGDLLLCKGLTKGRLVYKRQKTGKMVSHHSPLSLFLQSADRHLLHHAENADADVPLGILKVLEQRFALKHHLAARHRGVEQIRIALIIDNDNAVVRHIQALD